MYKCETYEIYPRLRYTWNVTKTRHGKWGMGNGGWEMGNGKWKMRNGKWEWEMGNGKWGIERGKTKI